MANRTWNQIICDEVVSVDKMDDGYEQSTHTLAESIENTKYVLLYFSAHWCGPCRQFTPVLNEWYKMVNNDKKQIEIIYISSDQDMDEFLDYSSTMSWKCVPFGNVESQAVCKRLKNMCQVSGIPRLVVFNTETRDLVTDDGRTDISNCMGNPNDVIQAWEDEE